jgi:hypothetical protein
MFHGNEKYSERFNMAKESKKRHKHHLATEKKENYVLKMHSEREICS